MWLCGLFFLQVCGVHIRTHLITFFCLKLEIPFDPAEEGYTYNLRIVAFSSIRSHLTSTNQWWSWLTSGNEFPKWYEWICMMNDNCDIDWNHLTGRCRQSFSCWIIWHFIESRLIPQSGNICSPSIDQILNAVDIM